MIWDSNIGAYDAKAFSRDMRAISSALSVVLIAVILIGIATV
ncbi:MAG: hypothetical protein WDM79_04615 [Terricaulis sp.]